MRDYRSLVVGGARGLGLSLTKESLHRGVEPVVLGQPAPDRGSVLEMDGHQVRFEPVQITDDTDVARCIDGLYTRLPPRFREVLYVPGKFLQGRFWEHTAADAQENFAVAVFGLMHLLRHLHPRQGAPYRLVVVASTSSYKIRPDEAIYGAAKAAEAQFVRNFHKELAKSLPGSASMIVHAGGMRTGFLPPNIDPADLMDPDEVASLIWDEMEAQDRGEYQSFHELHILRGKGGIPGLERGPRAPH